MKLKLLLFLEFVILMLFQACSSHVDEPEKIVPGSIVLLADNEIIRADGNHESVFTVLLTDENGEQLDVTSFSDIYMVGNDVSMPSPCFSSTEGGEYTFYAVYGFAVSPEVVVRAAEGLSYLPSDPAPDSKDFKYRMILLQHTGTECPNCPALMTKLKKLAEDEAYAPLYYHVASHSYNLSDNAYSSSAALLSRTLNVKYYPWLTFNLSQDSKIELDEIKTYIDEQYKDRADAGITMSASHSDGYVYVNVGVKAGVSTDCRLAVWLLEDNISGVQSGATSSWQHNHNNCLRQMCGEAQNERIYGKSLGSLSEGEVSEQIVAIELEDGWKAENCKVLAIVTVSDGQGGYQLANCAVCPVGETLPYVYGD